MAEARHYATEYTVSLLPRDDPNGRNFNITVEYRGDDKWAICWFRQCLSATGEWDWESIPSERTEEWLAAHRFDLDVALRLAKTAAPGVTCNGITAQAWVDRKKAQA